MKERNYDVLPISFDTWDGLKLRGSVYKPMQEKNEKEKGAVIVHHGISGNRHDVKEYAKMLVGAGFLVLTYDARGHNESEGELNVHRMIHDVSTAIDTLSQEYGYDEVGIMGHSLGGIVSSIATAKDERIKASISLSTPSSVMDVCEAKGKMRANLYRKARELWPQHEKYLEHALNFPVPSLFQNAGRYSRRIKKKLFKNTKKKIHSWEGTGLRVPRFGRHIGALLSIPDMVDYVPAINVPYLIFNGGAETDITPAQATKLYDACGSSKKELIIIDGEEHAYMNSRELVARHAKRLFSKYLNGV